GAAPGKLGEDQRQLAVTEVGVSTRAHELRGVGELVAVSVNERLELHCHLALALCRRRRAPPSPTLDFVILNERGDDDRQVRRDGALAAKLLEHGVVVFDQPELDPGREIRGLGIPKPMAPSEDRDRLLDTRKMLEEKSFRRGSV